jgi:hypothetical protein
MAGFTTAAVYPSRDGERLHAEELVDGVAKLYGVMPTGLDVNQIGT